MSKESDVVSRIVMAAVLAFTVLFAGCADQVDEQELAQVESWAVDMITTIETALTPARRWREVPEHPELHTRLEQHADGVAAVLDRRLPPMEVVETWEFELTRGRQVRDVHGPELAEAVSNLESLARSFEAALRDVVAGAGDEELGARLVRVIEALPQAIADLRHVLILPR